MKLTWRTFASLLNLAFTIVWAYLCVLVDVRIILLILGWVIFDKFRRQEMGSEQKELPRFMFWHTGKDPKKETG